MAKSMRGQREPLRVRFSRASKTVLLFASLAVFGAAFLLFHGGNAFFNPKGDFAAIVLSNTAPTRTSGSFADRLGQHISQSLAGQPAISLSN
jgi:hypothetical protein